MLARTRRGSPARRPTRSIGAVAALAVAALVGLAANQMTATAHPAEAPPKNQRPAAAPTPPPATPAQPSPAPATSKPVPDPATAGTAAGRALAAQVTADGVLAHLRAFQKIADANGGTRASGVGNGYTRSVDYVERELRRAGYRVTRQAFSFPYFEEVHPTTFRRTAPTTRTYRGPEEFRILSYSGNGVVAARVHPVDVNLTPPRASTSGCEAADFVGFPAGAVALLQRGTCDFSVKVRNAVDARAAGAIIFNQGNGSPTANKDRYETFGGTLQKPSSIPAIAVSYEIGADLAASPSVRVRIETDARSETRTTANLLAQLPGPATGRTVMVGAHLDSVPEGPGINDNGSGSAGVLEVAVRWAELVRNAESPPPNPVRFAWWGAEESGLLGAKHYVDHLTPAQKRAIALYLNFDMIGSPNYELGVYDGDNSDGREGTTRGPSGSAQIERFFRNFLAERGQKSAPSGFDGRSDYGPFIAKGVGIPAGGIDTGAEGIKSRSAAEKFGGVPGVAYDPCYHQACDGLTPSFPDRAKKEAYRKLAAAYGSRLVGNVNVVPLDLISDAIAAAVGRYAYDVSDVEGASASPSP
ncbi:M28 family peptidase [Cryptosporangium aurantiacum]|uniref:PA domain-containing protein n=1 Tax=Cryptosporangium aurantiacum TaxID=134849 RepID=A0A1M7Q2N6_9ACTN|nr:M28 family peptidase [Cryptosporangium aurantiacum]SHN24550.1 PA domain-containing protein [Cryptosporangium aurantiacum]